MSYTYLLEQEEVSSEVYCWDTDPCALLSMIDMPGIVLFQDKGTDRFLDSQYGTTSAHLTENHGKEKSILSAEDFPAKTYQQQEKEKGLKEKNQVFGRKCTELYMKFDQDTYSLRTHHCLFKMDLELSYLTLPAWGMMLDGVLWEQHPLEVGIYGKDAGSWPTPLKNEGPGGTHHKLTDAVAIAEGYKPRYYKGDMMAEREAFTGKVNPEWAEWLMGWPMGWTNASQELGTDKFQLWLQQHGFL